MKDENKNGKPDTLELNNDNSTSLVATEETTIDNPNQFEDISQTTFTATWGIPVYDSDTRNIRTVLTLSEDVGARLQPTSFRVEIRSGTEPNYRWTHNLNYSISITTTGTTNEIIAVALSSAVAGTYRITLRENAFEGDRPQSDISTIGVSVGSYVAPYALWSTPTLNQNSRSLSSLLTLSENPGSAFNITQDFEVEVSSGNAGSYTWSTATGWTLSTPSAVGTRMEIRAAASNTVPAGNYRLVLKQNAFGTGKPSSKTVTAGTYFAPIYSRAWIGIFYEGRTRTITGNIVFPENPGSALNATQDFEVQVRSGSPGSYTWAVATGWTLSAAGTTEARRIMAVHSTTVPTGFYRLIWKQNSFRTNIPNANIPSVDVEVLTDYTATWGTPQYISRSRDIIAELTLSEDPEVNGTLLSGIGLQLRSGSPGSYTWTNILGRSHPWIYGTGTNKTVIIRISTSDPVGTYRMVLSEDAFGNDRPNTNIPSSEVTVSAYTTPFAYWEVGIGYSTITRVISNGIVLSENPGSSFNLTQDFEVQVRSGSPGSYTWTTATGWTLSSSGSGTRIRIIATPAISVSSGIYRIRLKEDAFGSDKPNTNIDSYGVTVPPYIFRAEWQHPIQYFSQTIIGQLSISEEPGSALNATQDFELQVRSGSPGSYTWTAATGWTLSAIGTGFTKQISATPTGLPSAGTYRFVLKEDAFGTDKPNANIISGIITIRATPIVATATWSSVSYTSGKLTGTLTFNNAVTEISSSDFEILTNTNAATTGWSFDAIPATATANTGITISATPPSSTDGSFKIRLKATSVRGPRSTSDNSPSVNADTSNIRVDNRTVATAAWSNVSYTSGKLTGTLTFSGANITGISSSDFEILTSSDGSTTGWSFDTISSSATAGTGITIAANPPSNTNASFKIRLKRSSVVSGGGTTNNAPTSAVTTSAIAVDNRIIVATATWSSVSYTGGKLTGTLTFNQNVTGIAGADFEVLTSTNTATTGWTFDTISATATANTGITISATSPSGTEGSFKIRLKATSVRGPRATTDNSPSVNADTGNISIDNRRVATAAWSSVSYTSGKLTGTLTFSGANITGISDSDFEILNASDVVQSTGWSFDTISSTATSGTGITIAANPPSETNASFKIRLKATSVLSDGGTTNNAPTSAVTTSAIAVDNRGPVVATATWSSVSFTNDKLQGTLTFNQNVTGISSTDFDILNASDTPQTGWTFDSISSTASANTGITIAATPPSNLHADFKIRLKATMVRGPRATSDNSPAANVDTAATRVDSRPTVATGAWSNLTGQSVLSGRMTFSGAAVTGITSTDFEVLNASDQVQSSGWTITVSSSTATAGGFVTVTASPSAITDASFKLRLKATSVRSDGSSTDNAPANAVTSAATRVNSVTWNNVRFADNKIQANLRFTRGGTHISALQTSDFQVINEAGQNQGWSFDSVSNAVALNRDIPIAATAPTDTNGRFAIRILANAARDNPSRTQVPINNTDSAYIAIDNRIAYPVATASWSAPANSRGSGATLSATVTFSGTRVAGITSADFEVTNTNDVAQTGWSIAVTGGPNVADGGSVTVTATPPTSGITNADFKLRIKATSVRGGGSTYDNSPASATLSSSATINTTPTVATAAWSNISGGTTLSGRVTFTGGAITGIENTDFEVTDDASTPAVQTGWTIAVSSSTATNGGFVTVTATPPALTSDDFRLRIKATSVRSDTSTTDNAPMAAVLSSADTVDNLPTVATASWGTVTGGTGSSATLSSSITFSRAGVTNIETSDFEVLNASNVAQSNWTIAISSTTASDGGSVTVTATPPVDQNADFKLQLNAISVRSDSSPRDNAPAAVVRSATARVDSRPIVATASWGTITGGSTLSGPITFSGAAVANIEGSDFEVLSARDVLQTGWRIVVSSSTATNGGSVTVTATPPININERYKLRIKATSVRSDRSTRDNAPASTVTSGAAAVDTRPTVATASWGTVAYCSTSGKIESPLTFMRANITNIAAADFEIIDSTNTVHNWTFDTPSTTATAGTPITIRATVPSNTLGQYRFRLKGTSVRSDGATMDNAPTGNVTSAAIQLDTRIIFTPVWTIAGGETLVGTLTFNNAAAFGIANTDFEVFDNTTPTPVVQATGWTIVVSSASAIAGGSVTVTATGPVNTNARYGLRLKANSLQSGVAGSNNAPANNVDSGRVLVNNIPIIARAIWSNINYSTASGKIQGTLTFRDANVTNIEANDFEIINASSQAQGWAFDTPPTTAISGTPITIRAIVPSNVSGQFRFRLKRASVRSDNSPVNNAPEPASVSGSVSIDTRVRATGAWSNISGGTVLSGRITFSGAPVSGIEEGDFRVLNDSDQVQSNWTIVVSGNSVSLGGFITVTAAPNVAVNGNFKLRLNRNSVQSGSSGTNNAPNADIISSSAMIDSRTFSVATAAWSDMTGDETLSGRITFSGAVVTGITADDFEVLNASDVAQTGWTIAVSGSAVSNGGFVTVTATPSDLIDANFKLRLKANSVRSDSSPANNAPGLAVTSPEVEVNTVTWRTISYERTSRQIEGAIRFTGGSGTVSGIAATAFDILDENNVRQTGWTVNTPPSTATLGGDPIDVTASSTTATPGLFKIRMKARTAQLTRTSRSQSGPSGQQSMQIPANNVDSDTTEIPFGMATVTIPQGSQGGIQIALKQRSFHVDGSPEQEGPPFQQYLGTVFYDTRTVEFFGRWDYASWCETSNKIIASITFNKAITGLNVFASSNLNGDIQIENERKTAPKDGWIFSFAGHTGTGNNASLAANTPLTMEIQPPSNTYENVYLVFNINQATYDSTKTGPAQDIYTEVIPVDNRPADAIQDSPIPSWTVPTGTQTGTTAEFQLGFVNTSRGVVPVTGLEPDDFQITGIGSAMVTISSLSWLITLSGDAVGLDETHITITSTPANPVMTVAPFGTGNRTFMITLATAVSSLPTNTVIINQTAYPGVTTSITEIQGKYFIDVPLPMNQSGIITLILRKNAVVNASNVRGPINDSSSGSVPFDTRPSTPITDPDRSWALWTDLEGGTTLKGRLHFIGDAITALAPEDIDAVLDLTGNADNRFNITVSSAAVSAGQFVTVEATPRGTFKVDSLYRLRLKANSVMVGTETAPPEIVDSNPIILNTLLTWSAPTSGPNQAFIEATLTFNSEYEDIATEDFSVLDQTDTTPTGWTITFPEETNFDGTANIGDTLVVRGTPPATKPVYDSFRLQLNRGSLDRSGVGQTGTSPTNNLITDPILVATTSAPQPAADIPYLVSSRLPTSEVESNTITVDLDAQLNGMPQNIDDLRIEDIMITSPAGPVTFELLTRE